MKVNFKKILLLVITLVVIAALIVYFVNNKEKKVEYVEYNPEEEISEEQERQTMISLYFINKTTRKVEPEARLIDVKDLIAEPYAIITNMLIEGSKNDNHESGIPEGTKLLGTEVDGEILKLNFSKEFIDNHRGGKEEEEKTIESIVNTLTELMEVNAIRILIEGEENKGFTDGEVQFTNNFVRQD